MKLDDAEICRAIIKRFSERLLDSLESDIIIVGGGPAILIANCCLAKERKKVDRL